MLQLLPLQSSIVLLSLWYWDKSRTFTLSYILTPLLFSILKQHLAKLPKQYQICDPTASVSKNTWIIVMWHHTELFLYFYVLWFSCKSLLTSISEYILVFALETIYSPSWSNSLSLKCLCNVSDWWEKASEIWGVQLSRSQPGIWSQPRARILA